MIVGTFFAGDNEGWMASTFGSAFHYMGAVFVMLVALQLVLSQLGFRRETAYEQIDVQAVDLTPWKPAPVVGAILCLSAISIYAYFAM
jgi:SSS family solute:Na+ symporter